MSVEPLSPAASDVEPLMASILEHAGASETLAGFLDALDGQRGERHHVAGLAGAASAVVVAQAFRRLRAPLLVTVDSQHAAEALRDDLEAFLGERVLYLPEFESLPYDVRSPHLNVLDARLTALSRLVAGEHAVIVTTARALLYKVPSPKRLRQGLLSLAVGDPMDADELGDWLATLAYQRVNIAETHGDFARRGGILDVYSFGYTNPIRLEFDDEEIISIREYDPSTQRSVRRHERVTLLPRREMIVDDDLALEAAERLRAIDGPLSHDAEALALKLETEQYFVDMRRVAGYIEQDWCSVLEYLAPETVAVRASPRKLGDEARSLWAQCESGWQDRTSHNEVASPPADILMPWEAIDAELSKRAGFDIDPVVRSRVTVDADVEMPEALRKQLELDQPAADAPAPAGGPTVHFHTTPQESFGRSIEALRGFLDAQAAARNRVLIVCDNPGQRDRLWELVAEEGGEDAISGARKRKQSAERDDGMTLDAPAVPELMIEVGQLSAGFTWREVRLSVLTDHEIFARFRRRRVRRRFKAGLSIPSLTSLKQGDFVVHIDYGIGRYVGTKRLTMDGHETDCLEISYQRGDKLFIPVDQFDLIQRYNAEEGKSAPSLSKIGGTAWQKTKAKAQKAIEDMSEELLRTQAIRNERPGFAFSPDNVWQRQLESSFIYDDTPDQATATRDIKRDMEAAKPMDRLVCGDVGFGKTEVAIRAAFKAIQDGKQVGVLVPTTILASQHFQTFSERLSEFPVKVDMLSRFRTAAEARAVQAGIKSGEIDVVIGTHALLQKSIEFKDIGLIIVDEEQRFGVRHKEKLKQLKEVCDVLTLTATPIPRTMHQALLGTRDISLITTPPRDRVPVYTEIAEFDRDLIADALLREADRGGQSFFVHNRVQSIDATARFLQRICPPLTFGIAHGQMSERQLEQIIVDFVDKKFDVLVTTMIIESGIDMPTVNTMLVNRADRFGLAQLYQLRGRVGRSNHRAYCYLLVPPHRALSEVAEKRLRAIEEYNDLGSGIKVAMKDLEIRGAGNILGSQQHGHMVAVGYELYCRMLEDTMRSLQGETQDTCDTKVTTDLDAFLPEDYVERSSDKIDFYKRLAETTEAGQVDELIDELTDRYGRMGEAARNIFELRRVKLLASRLGIEEVHVGARRVRFEFASPPAKDAIGQVFQQVDTPFEFQQGTRFAMVAPDAGPDPLALVRRVLETLLEAQTTPA